MRIAIVTNLLTPYRKRFYDEMAIQLEKRGGVFRVFVMTDKLPLRPWTYENLKSENTELLKGVKVIIKGQDQLYNRSINRKIREFHPDVIILAGSWTYFTAWKMMLNKIPDAKYYFWSESHNVRATKVASKNPIVESFKKSFYKKFDGYCVPGKYASETVNELVGSYGQRVRLPNLVDDLYYMEANSIRSQKQELRRKYHLPNDKLVFFSPARLITIKGVDTFLKAINGNRYCCDAAFVLGGEGPLEDELKEIAIRQNLDVRLLGYCDQNVVRELYSCADFFLLPSLLDPNPLTVIEAAFSGLPLCVSYYVGNSPELVEDKINGVVFDTIDKNSVAEHFEFLMTSSSEWREHAGRKSLEKAKAGFQCTQETQRLIAYFDEERLRDNEKSKDNRSASRSTTFL